MTDEDARQLAHKHRKGLPSYNHQSAVDGRYGVVCAVHTSQRGDHPDDLLPLVEQAKRATGGSHQNVLADCGFASYETLEKLEDREELYHFHRDAEGRYTCPDGFPMEHTGRACWRKGRLADTYAGTHCGQCLNRTACTKMNKRHIYVDIQYPLMAKMREKLDSDRGRLRYKKRQGISEPVHGDDQKNRGWRQHHLRGLRKASAEFLLIRIATNVRKIARYRPQEMLA